VSEATSEVVYSRIDATDEWYLPGGDTTNPIKWPKVEPLKNRKERLATAAIERKLRKRLLTRKRK
jgi:hypothetical protein